ncbi:DUF4184 family protein [Massilia antarctica]|uniref:DUF4184 family protein n=1 Tax=Massilia antarctica TaxID=2765360 RepID=UPI0006BDDF31|nr:DUF4184 family protein [Massilia sp. H27-R4]MCY0910456.1 DUF4184 family protein [Massilia sp. H27-R4]CUI09194.1 hypothetical protein; putative membrane protein [Janthinobacterium sp. CG23_2]CUU32980.1 hypothetical protein; putative membrane protein [Janthinobacterium sp. CG23_2]
MPFTLCHPAIVIPLHRRARGVTSLPALVIGSMMPDFVYFFAFGVSGRFSHSVSGILLYCVPVGALVYLLYYALLRQAFLAWLPQALSARMAWQIRMPLQGARAAWVALLSLAIGASTHIAWDAFTHPGTWAVNYFGLARALVSIGGHDIPVFKVLQHMSSLIGFLAIASCTVTWVLRSQPGPAYPLSLSNRQRVLVLAVVGAAAVAGSAAGLLLRHATTIERGLFNAITTGMATAAMAVVLLCAGWKAWAHGRIEKS